MIKILITGKEGQVGWELQRALASLGKVYAFDRQSLDLQDEKEIRDVVKKVEPTVIVNAAAYTAVDKAEVEEDIAFAVNALGPKILAEEAKRLGASFIHYSTDYVFDGCASKPYLEEDIAHPLNAYGRTKLEGEKLIQEVGGKYLIFRTSWVYGQRGKNFLLTMLRLGKERDVLSIVDDQVGAPTWSYSIGQATRGVIADCFDKDRWEEVSGLYHLTSTGMTSWYGFAREIFKIVSHRGAINVPVLNKIGTKDYPLPAKRPLFSVLSTDKFQRTFNIAMPDWKDALYCCLETQLVP